MKEHVQPSMIQGRGAAKTSQPPITNTRQPLQMMTSVREIAARAFSNAALVAGCPSELGINSFAQENHNHAASKLTVN